MRRIILGFAVALAAFGCSPSHGDPAASSNPSGSDTIAGQLPTHPESGLPVIPLKVKSGKHTHDFMVEVATSRWEQARGLMFRTEMGPDEGMLFPFAEPREASFWMKNTVIPLDIIFVGADHRILNIAADAVPYSEDHLDSSGAAVAVLELNGGRAAQLGLKPGDTVQW